MRNPFGKYWRVFFLKTGLFVVLLMHDFKIGKLHVDEWFLSDTTAQNSQFLRLVIIMRSTFSITVSQTNFPQKTLLTIQTVHIPAVWNDTSLHPAYLEGNFLSARLTALTATLYPSPLFILKGSSAHSGLIRIITPPLLVFIIQFPSSLLLSATHCQSATL